MRLGVNGITLWKPSRDELVETAELGARGGCNHAFTGASECAPPLPPPAQAHKWKEDYDSYKVGRGKVAYERARRAVKQWQHMELGWVTTNRPAVEPGASVCIAACLLGLWMRNPLQVVFAREHNKTDVPRHAGAHSSRATRERVTGRRYDFGQTTRVGHGLAGEERFSVQWRRDDDSVWYEVYAFSRADTLLARATYPLARFFQKKFRRDSAAAMALAVAEEG